MLCKSVFQPKKHLLKRTINSNAVPKMTSLTQVFLKLQHSRAHLGLPDSIHPALIVKERSAPQQPEFHKANENVPAVLI